jgi:hypothetical protein
VSDMTGTSGSRGCDDPIHPTDRWQILMRSTHLLLIIALLSFQFQPDLLNSVKWEGKRGIIESDSPHDPIASRSIDGSV